MDEEKKPSYVLVQFADVGSVLMSIQLMNVTAGQLLAASKILDMKGQAGFIQEENERLQREAEQNIARPAQQILRPK